MDEKEDDVDKCFDEFWKELVTNPDGTLDPEKVKKELFDFYIVMQEVTTVYMDITGGQIAKPNTRAVDVLAAVDYHTAREFEQ